MNKIVRNVALAGFSAWMVFSAGIMPSLAADDTTKNPDKFFKKKPGMMRGMEECRQDFSTHHQVYLSYLVKEYAPETKASWDQAFTKRKTVVSQIKIKLDTEQGKVMLKEKREKMRSEAKKMTPEKRQEMRGKAQERGALNHQLAEALEKHDSKTIKEILPKLLEQYNKQTERMQEMQESLKNK